MISLGINGLGIANKAGSRPSLNLDFINSQIFDPRITFTRDSTATRVNANGLIEVVASGSPRIDFDPATQVCKGLLIEEQRTNLLTYSENFDNGAWFKARSQINSNVIVAPDGTLTADKLVEDTQTGAHHVTKTGYVFTNGTTYCLSVYVQAAERSKGTLNLGNGLSGFGGGTGTIAAATYDLIAGTCVKSTYADSAGIEQLSGGWFRVWLVGTCTTGAADNVFVGFLNNGTTPNYTGDGTSGLYLWGAQLETGSVATSYIPTVASTVTRAADQASMTGTNFSNWYNQTEGTVYFSGDSPKAVTAAEMNWSINDGTSNNQIFNRKTTSNYIGTAVIFNNVAQADVSNSMVISENVVYKCVASYKLDDISMIVNVESIVQDISAYIPNVSSLALGQNAFGGQQLNGHILKLSYYPKRLNNLELQALTKG